LTGSSNVAPNRGEVVVEGPLKGLIAGVAAWKLGGGCVSTILVFVLVYWLLGQSSC
jgi:hypothetical protein